MKYMTAVKKFAGGLVGKARELAQKARDNAAYFAPVGGGLAAALLIVPRSVGAGGWSLFSFETGDLVDTMMAGAESMFNGLIGAIGPIYGIQLGVALVLLVGTLIGGVIAFKKR